MLIYREIQQNGDLSFGKKGATGREGGPARRFAQRGSGAMEIVARVGGLWHLIVSFGKRPFGLAPLYTAGQADRIYVEHTD